MLRRFNSEDNASPLYLTEAAEDSHFFSSLGKRVRKALQEKPFAMENHSNGNCTLIRLAAYFQQMVCLILFNVAVCLKVRS